MFILVIGAYCSIECTQNSYEKCKVLLLTSFILSNNYFYLVCLIGLMFMIKIDILRHR